jgi:hypothetical protein
MIIYQVFKNVSRSDSDNWQYWIDQHPKSYHLSLDGAQAKIAYYIEKGVEELKSHSYNEGNDFADLLANRITLPVGDNGHYHEEGEWFGIQQIEVED